MKEIRYIVKVDPDKLPIDIDKSYDYREDIYFKDFRVRKSVFKNRTLYFKINTTDDGKSNKKKEPIDEKTFNSYKNKFHMFRIISKGLTVRNRDNSFYIEKIYVYKNNELIDIIWSTEYDPNYHKIKFRKPEDFKDGFVMLDFVLGITKIKEPTLREFIVKNVLKKDDK